MKLLPHSFYTRPDVVMIARELLGKIVVSTVDGERTSGIIVEAEAYCGMGDKASHASNGKRTARNEHMYREGAHSYIYVCYGIHQMLNFVTNIKDVADGVLIRAIEPVEGIDVMCRRTSKLPTDTSITKGPGNVSKALGLTKHHSGTSLIDDVIQVYDPGKKLIEEVVGISKRIGVDYAGEDALLPWRFYVKGNSYVSGRPNK